MKVPVALEAMLKLANRLHVASEDMWEARTYFDEIQWDRLYPRNDPALIAMIVVYARPFVRSRSEGHAAPKLLPEDLGLFENCPALNALHSNMIDLRNKAVAHSDWSYHRTTLSDTKDGLSRQKSKVLYQNGLDIELLPLLLEHVGRTCQGLAYDLDLAYLAAVDR